MSKTFCTLLAGIGIGAMLFSEKGSRARNRLSQKAQQLKDRYSEKSPGAGSPVPPLGRDSGLSRQISPEITGIE